MKTILVPTDFSECASNAVQTAINYALKSGHHLELIHVINAMEFYVPIEPMTGISMYSPEVLNPFFNEQMSEAKRKLNIIAEDARDRGLKATYRVNYSALIEEIERIEKEKSYDLIIIGTKGSSGFDEVFIGSNTQRLIRYAKKPVLAVKDVLDFNEIQNAIFVSDFDENVIPAINKTKDFLAPFQKDLQSLFINTPQYFEDSISSEERIQHVISNTNSPEMPFHIFNDFSVEEGISAFSVKNEVDFIAITTHGYTGIRKLFNANITEAVVNHINLPILSIPFQKA